MKIAILNLLTPDAGLEHYGTIGTLISGWLSPHLPEAELTEVLIAAGEAFPTPEQYDGYILSGSEKGVYDEATWMQPLREFVLALRGAEIPVFGICFGHQIMADVYGGKAEKVDNGFVVGPREFAAGAGEDAEDSAPFAARVMHQDQVTAVPPHAKVMASAAYCPVAVLEYDFPAKSVQFHPEYPGGFVAEAVELFDGNIMTAQEAKQARESIAAHEVADDLYGVEVAEFFRAHIHGALA